MTATKAQPSCCMSTSSVGQTSIDIPDSSNDGRLRTDLRGLLLTLIPKAPLHACSVAGGLHSSDACAVRAGNCAQERRPGLGGSRVCEW
ncbi:unnamed protein product [Zymoseptoria tritici ST99CH_3D7]|uniref:Uncharacterized protein n=1 Tax=Zymoseptoria tritici (strain ST99CH_3D7) TaxID=1276538 RepID=A0A1X7S9Y9_ZYMT9|nr:unnamed protein product [Zymoseptoria tritici ST99CH_3D7]